MRYRAPDPTEEQIANARIFGFDVWDRAGLAPFWELAPDDTIAAAATIHDEMYIEGGPKFFAKLVDRHFARDCMILARATDGYWARKFEIVKAMAAGAIVSRVGGRYWKTESRNNPVTRAQGALAMHDAKAWINKCAVKIGEKEPYLIRGAAESLSVKERK